MRIIVDTGPVVALLNSRDSRHAWCVEQAGLAAPPFYTCEAVLTEAHFLLAGLHQGTRRLVDLVGSGRIRLTTEVAGHMRRVGELMLRYHDVPMSFADACLVCMAEVEDSAVFTLDRDFSVYRRGRSDPLRLIMP